MMELSPELLQLMVASNQRDNQDQQLQRQQHIADMLRMQSSGQGHMAGRVFIPRNIGNVAADAYSGYKGSQMQPGIDQGMKTQATTRDNLRAQYLQMMIQALKNQRGGGMQQPQQDFVMPGTPQAGP